MSKSQTNAPLFDAVLKHARKRMVSFHTPGHKNGRSIDKKFRNFVGSNIFYMDVTVFDEVDSLHHPVGPIKEAQELAAKAYGSKHCFFLVNGSTVGLQAMIMSACNPNDVIILSRNTHKSVMAGIILSGATPVYLSPKIDHNLNIMYNLSVQEIEQAIEQHPEAKAVFVTNPIYCGITTDLRKIAKVVHKHKKLLLVDEAWGSHLKFHPSFPVSALDAGADMCVQSIHKTASAMSQGSVIHLNSKEIELMRVKGIISMLQTTSPSYIVLASIDLARRQLFVNGKKICSRMIKMADKARREIDRIDGIVCLKQDNLFDGYSLDVTKITFNISKLGLTGYEVSRMLNQKYNIQVDYQDIYNLIAVMGVGNIESDIDKLIFSLKDIARRYRKNRVVFSLGHFSYSTEIVYNPRDAFARETERLPLKKAVGRVSAETLSSYPPGIPILIPGERVTQEVCEYIHELTEMGIRISGQDDNTLKTIRVIK